MARMTEKELIQITREIIEKYDGSGDDFYLYLLRDDQTRSYALNGVRDERRRDSAFVFMQARVVDDFIVIDRDMLSEKQLWKALVQAGVPREQIVLAYAGEQVPMTSEG